MTKNSVTDILGSARSALAITPHDTNALTQVDGDYPRAIYVGGAGNIALRLYGDTADVTLTAVPVGTVLNLRASHVRSTSTTATNLVALYR